MANKRMFSKNVTGSDLFRELPLTAQAVYMHLNMEADDRGFFNNAKSVCRTIGADYSDVRALIDANFIIEFDTGAMVIRHFHVNNNLSVHTTGTLFEDELSLLAGGIVIDEEKSSKKEGKTSNKGVPYRLKTPEELQAEVTLQYQRCNTNVAEENRLEEKRGGENRLDKNSPEEDSTAEEMIGGMGERETNIDTDTLEVLKEEFRQLVELHPNPGDETAQQRAFELYIEERTSRGTTQEEVFRGLVDYLDRTGENYRHPELWQFLKCGQWQK